MKVAEEIKVRDPNLRILALLPLAAASVALAAAPDALPRLKGPAATAAAAPVAKPMGSAQLLASLRARFTALDANHDGSLDVNEIAAAQQKNVEQARAIAQQRLDAEFARLDTNHDGQLTKVEFMAALPSVRPKQTTQQVIAALDGNGDGKISLEEYEAGPLLSYHRPDANHDGTVNPQEIESVRVPKKRP